MDEAEILKLKAAIYDKVLEIQLHQKAVQTIQQEIGQLEKKLREQKSGN